MLAERTGFIIWVSDVKAKEFGEIRQCALYITPHALCCHVRQC